MNSHIRPMMDELIRHVPMRYVDYEETSEGDVEIDLWPYSFPQYFFWRLNIKFDGRITTTLIEEDLDEFYWDNLGVISEIPVNAFVQHYHDTIIYLPRYYVEDITERDIESVDDTSDVATMLDVVAGFEGQLGEDMAEAYWDRYDSPYDILNRWRAIIGEEHIPSRVTNQNGLGIRPTGPLDTNLHFGVVLGRVNTNDQYVPILMSQTINADCRLRNITQGYKYLSAFHRAHKDINVDEMSLIASKDISYTRQRLPHCGDFLPLIDTRIGFVEAAFSFNRYTVFHHKLSRGYMLGRGDDIEATMGVVNMGSDHAAIVFRIHQNDIQSDALNDEGNDNYAYVFLRQCIMKRINAVPVDLWPDLLEHDRI